MADVSVRPLLDSDWESVRQIYIEGIASGNGTFETEAPAWEPWNATHRADCRIVAARDGRILGWAALSPVSVRRVYAGVAEVSIYVGQDARGGGVGAALLGELIACSEDAGVWTLRAGIFPENTASLALHERHGFRRLGVQERVGYGLGRWRDVVLLERRSARTGIEPPV
jgi:L-amino acid N-acyltransferase YncA